MAKTCSRACSRLSLTRRHEFDLVPRWLERCPTLVSMNHSDDLRIVPRPEASERSAEEYAADRRAMVETQLRRRAVKDCTVLEAMVTVPRHEFVPPEFRYRAYD